LGHAREIVDLPRQAQVVIAGAGVTPEIARLTQTCVLDHDPVSRRDHRPWPHGPR
jgi:hypothetical protein